MTTPSRISITDIKIVPLKTVRHVGEIEPAWDLGGKLVFNIGGGAFTEVHTNEGITGIGPAFSADLLPAIKEQLVGKDPFDIEQHAATLRYYASGLPYRGAAGVDMALIHRTPYFGNTNDFYAESVRRYPNRLQALAYVEEWKIQTEPDPSISKLDSAITVTFGTKYQLNVPAAIILSPIDFAQYCVG